MPEPRIRPARGQATFFERGLADLSAGVAGAPAGSPIPFVVSTAGVKRDGLDLRANGWWLNRYRTNPVVLWCHDITSEPIGRADDVSSRDQRLVSPIVFDQEDPRAVRIESKVRRRFISGSSVQWEFVDEHGRTLDTWRMSPDQLRDEAYYDLLETSVVPIPSDPQALAMRQRAALGRLGRQLVSLYDEQEHPRSPVTAPQLRAAVRSELRRLGIDLALAAPVTWTYPHGPARGGVNAARRRFGRGAIPSHRTDVVEGTWDADAVLAATPAQRTALRGIHAWVDYDGDPDAKSSYKLPHHAIPGGPANLNGVRNALARLPQTDMPDADRGAVERHLRRHLDAQTDDSGRAHATNSAAARSATVDEAAARAVLAAFDAL